jgi:DNA modification methylase
MLNDPDIQPLALNDGTYHWNGLSKLGTTWDVYHGDAAFVLEQLSKVMSKTFNCVITSPPYYWLRDYGVEGQIGHEKTIDRYVNAISDVMDEVWNILSDDGVLFLNLGDTYYSGKGKSHGIDRKNGARRFGLRAVDESGLGVPKKTIIGIPWRVALEMISRGWVLRSPIIWVKEKSLPECVRDRPRRKYEYVFMFVKNRYYYFNKDPIKGEEDVWHIPDKPNSLSRGKHTAAFPDKLVQRCLDVGCPEGGSVLDPFAGSGTTMRVAVESGRSATGIDLSRDYCNYMVKVLSELDEERQCTFADL